VPINSRSERLLASLESSGRFEIVVCGWSRSNVPSLPANYRVLNMPTGHGPLRLLNKVLGLPAFRRFAAEVCRQVRPDILGCSFWDMALVAASVARQNTPILYDISDMPRGSGPELWVGRMAERLALTRVRAVTLASRFYAPFYKPYRSLVLENLPALDTSIRNIVQPELPPRLGYIGNVRYPTMLRPLMQICASRQIPLAIHGGGVYLTALSREFAAHPQISFHGAYAYADLARIYGQIDIVWAAYPADDFNVRHAISNKFFESVWYGRPAVFSRGTALGDLVEREGMGFVIDAADPAEVGKLLEEIMQKPERVLQTWQRLVEFRHASNGLLTWTDQEQRLVEFVERECSLGY